MKDAERRYFDQQIKTTKAIFEIKRYHWHDQDLENTMGAVARPSVSNILTVPVTTDIKKKAIKGWMEDVLVCFLKSDRAKIPKCCLLELEEGGCPSGCKTFVD